MGSSTTPAVGSAGLLQTLHKLCRFRRELSQPKNSAKSERSSTQNGDTATECDAVARHCSGGEYTKSIVYGGLDGIITTFAIVCACEGGDLGGKALLCLGLSNLIADGLSMGIGDWVSEKAEEDFISERRKVEMLDFTSDTAKEVRDMAIIYAAKYSVSEADAETILGAMRKYPDLFVDHAMALELEMIPPSDASGAARKGLVTFSAFVGFGAVPLLALALSSAVFQMGPRAQFRVSCACTGACIYALGAGRGLITHQPVHPAGLTMMVSGGFAAVAAYAIASIMASQITAPAPVCQVDGTWQGGF